MAMTVGHIPPASYPCNVRALLHSSSALQHHRHATSLLSGAVHKVLRLPTTQIWWPRRRRTLPITSFFKFSPKLPEIVEAGDPVLYEPAAAVPVQDITTQRIQKIIEDMIAVMRAAPGVGLAAPQLGVPLQIIVLEDTKEYISYVPKEETEAQQRFPFDLLVICNPKLKEKGNKSASFFEGCLSIHGYRALVERHLEVEVTGYGRDGLPIKVEASGWQARILQHECDHLKGVLFVDKMIPKTFRTANNLRLPLPAGSPKPGVCLTTKKGTQS